MRHRTTRLSAVMLGAATLTLGLAACTDASETSSSAAAGGEGFATATLKNPDGADAGTVTFAEDGERVTVTVEARDLEPGFRGFHIHTTGLCEPNSQSPDGEKTGDFLSAGGHLTGDAGDRALCGVIEE